MFDYTNVDPKLWNMTLFKEGFDCDNVIILSIKGCLSRELQDRNLFGESMQQSSNRMGLDDCQRCNGTRRFQKEILTQGIKTGF